MIIIGTDVNILQLIDDKMSANQPIFIIDGADGSVTDKPQPGSSPSLYPVSSSQKASVYVCVCVCACACVFFVIS